MSVSAEGIGRAIVEGRQSRQALTGQLVREFRKDPGGFDPRRLERLGETGLRQFLGQIDLHGAASRTSGSARSAGSGQRRKESAPHRSQTGWRHLRRSEWPAWMSGAAAGIHAGGLTTAAGLLFVLMIERVLPLVRGVLS